MSCPHGNHPDSCDTCDEISDAYSRGVEHTKQALAAQPAPVQEPVAIPEYIRDAAKHLHENRFEPSFRVRAIVGWINGSPPAQPALVQGPYSAPVKELWPVASKPWVGLTDEEIDFLYRVSMDIVDSKGWGFLNHEKFAEHIEAKLKEKNYGKR
jgi:hypothetical protein